MFKKHPKGLLAASLSNMGERFGFYIMMAILSLFLAAKFGLTDTQGSIIYATFYFFIYALALLGGYIADRTKQYKNTISAGIILMAVGYAIIAIPTETPVSNLPVMLTLTCFGLFTIAFGNGLFKGNLQALVGQMYDEDPKYADKRDEGFSIFYMCINIGAIFAPLFAIGIRNMWLKTQGFLYDADLPSLCHRYLGGTLEGEAATRFSRLASEVTIGGASNIDLTTFANQYLNTFNTGFHYAFATAIIGMLISLTVFLVNKKKFPDPQTEEARKAAAAASGTVEMTVTEIKQRLYALFAVFGVVIFFWFSFHQNGITLTYFARDYVDLSMINFNLFGVIPIQGAEIFQVLNPTFVVCLTPILLGIFGWLRAKGKEPSAPRKIAIGMGIAALAFIVMSVGSMDLPLVSQIKAMGGLGSAERVTPFLLVGTYFILTVAELFISPLGLSFVSKVAPPQYQGIMQGCWLGATAIGNQLILFGAFFYERIPVWATWSIFVGACLISMFAMLFMVKWLERITK